jgi:hypothetical protein
MSTTYTKQDLEASIAKLRALAPRAKAYRTASHWDFLGDDCWVTGRYRMNTDGTDEVDDFDLCEGGLQRFEHIHRCRSEEGAVHLATRDNIDAIDRIERPQWFTADGKTRKKAHPREMSPALSGVLA